MKKTIKIILFFTLTFATLLFMSCISKAASTETATDEATLRRAIENVDDGETVEIQNNITVTGPIVIQKQLTIDGNGYTIAGSTDWTSTSGNQTMFTAQFAAGKLTLKDIDLNNGPKYGVQSYDGATVILDNVSITGFRYGGVLANGGNVEVRDLHLGTNGTGANNGIEIDKGAAATNNPSLIMNGTLTSDSAENVVRPAENGHLTDFTITNTENTTNKVVIAEDKVVLTDKNNNVISESFIPENVKPNIDIKTVMVNLIIGDETKKIVVNEGSNITEKELRTHVELEEGYELVGFFTDKEYKQEFDFSKSLTTDTTIYAKVSKIEESKPEEEIKPEEPEKEPEEKPELDNVPQTGVQDYLGIAILSLLVSIAGLVYIEKSYRE